MEHTQTTLADILGRTQPCIFKARFHYNPCRSCDGLNQVCESYLASVRYDSRPQHKTVGSKDHADGEVHNSSRALDSVKTADAYSWIRRANDMGAITG